MAGTSDNPQGNVWGMGSGHGGAPVPVSLGLDSTADLIPRNLMIFPPEIYPIPDAVEFNPLGSTTTIIAETKVIPGVALQLPQSYIGIIRGYTIYVDNMLLTTNLIYTLLINGNPAPGYGSLTMFPRAAPSVSNGFDAFIRVPDGAALSVKVQNVDGGSYTVGASISGWIWPRAAGERWIGGGY